jgi:hypothetical protein
MFSERSRLSAAGIVQAHLARIERGEILAAIEDYAPDGVLEALGAGNLEGSVLTGTFQGREALGRANPPSRVGVLLRFAQCNSRVR